MNFLKWTLILAFALSAPLLAPAKAMARESEVQALDSPETSEAQALRILSRYPKI